MMRGKRGEEGLWDREIVEGCVRERENTGGVVKRGKGLFARRFE